ncbi:tRNA preQ1(34) S-adenosylmethionine ribosyltransferase-isomerase QueA [Pseudemcibacter aquimaris]|uniref:tRNA preQ1(34) S-adenosylmethionine ribosyltransferase-isomerase QueA n=1 Tax=Pseudemcibacter aquimaris TaxID=2857064 RepID=UPI0020129E55|nr:tRNA preQ1(34) S-adenosylmethionine ribosyltransferase-isomerase QueA [Pseudemcibacter aquimaris]MCC3860106.1 tRNA preQ1(34) S-adenosylmethionine ribosyltransferase-isomerase QueA [Pseudemcibacter aquimaris]WDU57435.1 tRNA preQ1(34) S-adenosylmethionine ribosyltransferase-isomerase QueA [Pseudemcibacter aquimaris]
MKVDQFDFELPKELIAIRPAPSRDGARLLVVNGKSISDSKVTELPDNINPGDLMIFNDTRVIPARLKGKRGIAKMELTLHMNMTGGVWKAFAKPAKKLKVADVINFDGGLDALCTHKGDAGEVTIKFNKSDDELSDALKTAGVMPLPPYIASQRPVDARDEEDYQTIYSKNDGAVAAPTAGLHFTENLQNALKEKGVNSAYVTLHVGAGTFLPVKVDDTEDHKMHEEYGELSKDVADLINETHARGNKVIAVGTTSLRLLESATDEDGVTREFAEATDIFITPGYKFRCVDMLMTNFHLPKSTLFMLVSAFAGFENMKAAYAHAIQNEYRFYSYGDSSILFREDR